MYQVGAEALLPPRDISVSQWADENVKPIPEEIGSREDSPHPDNQT